jgi:lipopolysaccharide assembly protein A
MTATPHGGSSGQEHPSGTQAPAQPPAQQEAKPPRISRAWVALALFAVVLLLLLVFILENSQSVDISYFGAHGHVPLGVALLLAAVLGILLAVIAWFGRGLRVRTAAHRHRKT